MSIESVSSPPITTTLQPTISTLTTQGNGNGNGPPETQSESTIVKISPEAKALLEQEQIVSEFGNGNGNGPP